MSPNRQSARDDRDEALRALTKHAGRGGDNERSRVKLADPLGRKLLASRPDIPACESRENGRASPGDVPEKGPEDTDSGVRIKIRVLESPPAGKTGLTGP
jgi:hypothetical protein